MFIRFAQGILAAALCGVPTVAAAAAVVRCEGPGLTAFVDDLQNGVFDVRLQFPDNTSYRFQAHGIIRSDRGFATWGSRGLVYGQNERGQLIGWVGTGASNIRADLSCRYLR